MVMRNNVWVLDVKKLANALSGTFAKVGAPKTVHKNVYLGESFD